MNRTICDDVRVDNTQWDALDFFSHAGVPVYCEWSTLQELEGGLHDDGHDEYGHCAVKEYLPAACGSETEQE